MRRAAGALRTTTHKALPPYGTHRPRALGPQRPCPPCRVLNKPVLPSTEAIEKPTTHSSAAPTAAPAQHEGPSTSQPDSRDRSPSAQPNGTVLDVMATVEEEFVEAPPVNGAARARSVSVINGVSKQEHALQHERGAGVQPASRATRAARGWQLAQQSTYALQLGAGAGWVWREWSGCLGV